MSLAVEVKQGHYVFEKDGVIIALSLAQVIEMRNLLDDIIDAAKQKRQVHGRP
jgi:hypothetical protein